jgi:hypothetical protein
MAITYNTSIVRSGLILHLDAANPKSYPGSGTAWRDLSGNGNNGTLTNGPTYSSSNKGSIVFDGVDDYVNCGTGLAQSGSWTLTAFAKFSNTTAQVIIGRTGDGSTSFAQNYNIFTQSSKFRVGTSSDSYRFADSTTTMIINTWYYITGVYDSATKILSIYVNGTFESSAAALTGTPPTAGTQYVILGASDGLSAANRMTGNISSASIYNRALTALEISQNFESLRGRYGI